MSVPALQSTVTDLVTEYDEKREALAQRLEDFADAIKGLEMGSTVQGKYVGPVLSPHPHCSEDRLQKNLLMSGWKAIYDRLQIDRIASAKDKQLFERTFENPPPLTYENAKATFGDYLLNARGHILRGLAEVFADLDPAYKSHSKVRIGVKGLPKRVIISGFGGFGEYGRNKLRDIVNALAAYRGQPLMEQAERNAIRVAHDAGEDAVLDGRTYSEESRYSSNTDFTTLDRGITVRAFRNGNAHVIFDKAAQIDINRALAEYYGEVLPDTEDEDAIKRPGTDVAKDLQFYPTPEAAVWALLDKAGIYKREQCSGSWQPPRYRVLEPSCGDGRILDALAEAGHDVFGIEVHAGRAAQARAKGHPVQVANFLDTVPTPSFDRVVMNPPFYGKHYLKHVRHALRFLKPDGYLVTILPATAHYDHQELEGQWWDLPVGSFAESGTNVPTGILRITELPAQEAMAA